MEVYLQKMEKQKKANTVLSYRRDLFSLASYFDPKPLSQVSYDELFSYFSFLSQKASAGSLSRALSVARGFFRYLLETGQIRLDPMKGICASCFSCRKEEMLKSEDFSRLICDVSPGIRGRRDAAMIALLCETGIQVSELVALDRKDILFAQNEILCGAGPKRRSVPLTGGTMDLIDAYLSLARLQNPEESALFLGSSGKRMTRQGFWKNLKDRALRLGIQGCTPQGIRQALSMHLIHQGKSKKQVLSLLGNRSDALLRQYEKQKRN